jgi:hypothetical protein
MVEKEIEALLNKESLPEGYPTTPSPLGERVGVKV